MSISRQRGERQVTHNCVFCEIVAGHSPASVVHEDELSLCFMTLRPTRPGECMVIPKDHIDHFIDIPAELLAHLVEITRSVGRAIQDEFAPTRVGLVVHGFGVPHAHFILVPQHDATDITSARFAVVEDGEVAFRYDLIPELSREQLDQCAERIRDRLNSRTSSC